MKAELIRAKLTLVRGSHSVCHENTDSMFVQCDASFALTRKLKLDSDLRRLADHSRDSHEIGLEICNQILIYVMIFAAVPTAHALAPP